MTAMRVRRGAAHALPTVAGGYWNVFAAHAGKIIAVGSHNDASGLYATVSSDAGATWSAPAAVFTGSPRNFFLCATASGFCLVVEEGIFPSTNHAFTTPDGVTWTTRSIPGTNGAPYGLRYYGGRLMCLIDADDAFLTSDNDGATWTARALPRVGNQLYDIGYNGTAVIIPQSALGSYWINRSLDLGNTWTSVEVTSTTIGLAFCLPDSTDLRLIGGNGSINYLSQDDGATWTPDGGAQLGYSYAGTAAGVVMTQGDGHNPQVQQWSYDAGATWQQSGIISVGWSIDDYRMVDGTLWFLDNPPDGETATLYPVIVEPLPHYVLSPGVAVALTGAATWEIYVPPGILSVLFNGDLTDGRGTFDFVVDPDGVWWDWEVDAGSSTDFDFTSDYGFVAGRMWTGTIDSYGFDGGTFVALFPFWTGFVNCEESA